MPIDPLDERLPWCGCGSPGRATELLMDYLERVDREHFLNLDNDVDLLLAYAADGADLTEHGTSVRGAWLTDAGRALLEGK